MSARVVEALAARGIDAPFRIQSLVLPDALAGLRRAREVADRLGQDARLRARRSSSARRRRERAPAALVLVPTRELALQVAEELAPLAARAKRLRVAAVYGGAPLGRAGQAREGAHILVATPGRLRT